MATLRLSSPPQGVDVGPSAAPMRGAIEILDDVEPGTEDREALL